MEQFTYESKDILDRLYQDTIIIDRLTNEDFQKLPLSEEYKKNQEEKRKILESNQEDIKKLIELNSKPLLIDVNQQQHISKN
jgi:hypothetical protein